LAQNIEVGQIIKTIFYCEAGAQGAQNVKYWRVQSVSGLPMTDLNVASRMNTLFKPLYVACISTQAKYRGVTAQILAPTAYDVQGVSDLTVGTGTGDLLPTEISILATFRSGLAGRMHRNRVFVPFPAEAENGIDGKPTAGYLTRVDNLAAQMNTSVVVTVGAETATLVPVVWPGLLPSTGETQSTYSVATLWSSLDSRSARSSANPNPFL